MMSVALMARLRQIDPSDLLLPPVFWPSGGDSSVSALPLALAPLQLLS